MRRYDDPVEVRRRDEQPDQFLWRGRLWKVRAVLAHWVETGAWWQSTGVARVLGTDEPAADPGPDSGPDSGPPPVPIGDLLTERELWRVEAGRGARVGPDGEPDPGGVFDLSLDWADGRWSLVGCQD